MSGRKVTTARHPGGAAAGAGRDGRLRLSTQLTAPLPEPAHRRGDQCPATEKEVQGFLRRNEVQVSVFNAGNREGLAGTTLEKIEDAGYRAGNTGNAPKSAEVRRAVVWTTDAERLGGRLVA